MSAVASEPLALRLPLPCRIIRLMPSRPRLLALDLDGTVVNLQGQVSPAARAALHACSAAGIALAFLTGRRPLTAAPLLDAIGLPCLVATNSGCLRWQYPSWNQIGRRMFPMELVPRVAELTQPWSVNFYLDAGEAGYEFIQLRRETTPEAKAHLERYGRNVYIADAIEEVQRFNVTQAALPAAPAIVEDLHAKVCAALDGQVLALNVRWPLLPTVALEVFHPQANKGDALASFAKRLGFTREECLAAGDDVNDIEMLRFAGRSAAMPQAGPEVRAVSGEQLKLPPGGEGGDPSDALPPYLQRVVDGEMPGDT